MSLPLMPFFPLPPAIRPSAPRGSSRPQQTKRIGDGAIEQGCGSHEGKFHRYGLIRIEAHPGLREIIAGLLPDAERLPVPLGERITKPEIGEHRGDLVGEHMQIQEVLRGKFRIEGRVVIDGDQ